MCNKIRIDMGVGDILSNGGLFRSYLYSIIVLFTEETNKNNLKIFILS